MTTTREQALRGLFLYLKNGLSGVEVLRNEVLSTTIPATGLVIIRDGDSGEPDILLSRPRYIYKHRAELEIFAQHEDAEKREVLLDDLLTRIGLVLQSAGSLGGVIDILSVDSPELYTEPIDGAASVKAAIVPVTLEYVTDHPLI